jgi:hypothetical protein
LPLGYFELKDINTLKLLPDNHFSNKKNLLEIKVNSYFKKNIPKGERTFYFSTNEKNKIYEILISLNFLRVKSIYDDFTKQFGTVSLPMNHEIKVSKKAKTKMNINLEELRNNDKKYINNISNFNNNSNPSKSSINKTQIKKKDSFLSRNSLNDIQFYSLIPPDKSNKFLKDDIKLLYITGVITLIANIQKINDGYEYDKKTMITDVDFVKDKIDQIFKKEDDRRY